MNREFPVLPDYEYSWRSIQIEPIPHSGERVTLGAIIKADDDALFVAKLVPYSKFKAIYGKEFGSRLYEAFRFCVSSAEAFYSSNSLSDKWIPPFDGFSTSESKKSVAEDLEDGLLRISRKCSSISISMEATKNDTKNKGGSLDPKTWRKEIIERVTVKHKNFEAYFNQEVKLRGSGVPLKFGFISENYVAQFDTISTSNAARQSGLVRAQSKLWQLDQLRDSPRFFPQNKYELLLHQPESEKDESKYSATPSILLNKVRDTAGEIMYKLIHGRYDQCPQHT